MPQDDATRERCDDRLALRGTVAVQRVFANCPP